MEVKKNGFQSTQDGIANGGQGQSLDQKINLEPDAIGSHVIKTIQRARMFLSTVTNSANAADDSMATKYLQFW